MVVIYLTKFHIVLAIYFVASESSETNSSLTNSSVSRIPSFNYLLSKNITETVKNTLNETKLQLIEILTSNRSLDVNMKAEVSEDSSNGSNASAYVSEASSDLFWFSDDSVSSKHSKIMDKSLEMLHANLTDGSTHYRKVSFNVSYIGTKDNVSSTRNQDSLVDNIDFGSKSHDSSSTNDPYIIAMTEASNNGENSAHTHGSTVANFESFETESYNLSNILPSYDGIFNVSSIVKYLDDNASNEDQDSTEVFNTTLASTNSSKGNFHNISGALWKSETEFDYMFQLAIAGKITWSSQLIESTLYNITSFFGAKNGSIQVISFISGDFNGSLSWYNRSINITRCGTSYAHALYRKMKNKDGSINDSFRSIFKELDLMDVNLLISDQCAENTRILALNVVVISVVVIFSFIIVGVLLYLIIKIYKKKLKKIYSISQATSMKYLTRPTRPVIIEGEAFSTPLKNYNQPKYPNFVPSDSLFLPQNTADNGKTYKV